MRGQRRLLRRHLIKGRLRRAISKIRPRRRRISRIHRKINNPKIRLNRASREGAVRIIKDNNATKVLAKEVREEVLAEVRAVRVTKEVRAVREVRVTKVVRAEEDREANREAKAAKEG